MLTSCFAIACTWASGRFLSSSRISNSSPYSPPITIDSRFLSAIVHIQALYSLHLSNPISSTLILIRLVQKTSSFLASLHTLCHQIINSPAWADTSYLMYPKPYLGYQRTSKAIVQSYVPRLEKCILVTRCGKRRSYLTKLSHNTELLRAFESIKHFYDILMLQLPQYLDRKVSNQIFKRANYLLFFSAQFSASHIEFS